MALINPSRATGKLFGPVGKKTSFGWVTDCHLDQTKVTDTSQGGKYYTDTEHKLQDIAAIFNARNDLAFCFQNGDFIDGANSDTQALLDLATAKAAYNITNVPCFHNIGNHEVSRLTKEQIMGVTGQPSKWYSFITGGVCYIVLDGNYTADDDNADLSVSFGTSPSPYVSYIPPTQRAWLDATIAASNHPCVIFCHYPVYYTGAFSWGLTNAAAVRTILEAYPDKVIGCVCGHLHENFIRRVNGILYATTHATVTGAYPTLNYSIFNVYPDAMTFTIMASGDNATHVEAAAP